MRKIIIAAALAAIASPAAASDQTDIEAVVKGYNSALSPSYCASPAAIIDEFGQHSWIGATACADWAAAFNADAKANGITDPVVTPGKPEHILVNGDRAYAVFPATYDFKEKGKKVHEKSSWTFAFQKIGGQWKIAAWTWSLH